MFSEMSPSQYIAKRYWIISCRYVKNNTTVPFLKRPPAFPQLAVTAPEVVEAAADRWLQLLLKRVPYHTAIS
jgi:hypothetical protein